MQMFRKCLYIGAVLFSFHSIPCYSFTLGDKLKKAEKGDYIVTEQNKSYSLLLVRSIGKDTALLEEISIPVSSLPSRSSWKKWMADGAPGHTSWIMYEIDLTSFSLVESYSFTKKGWLFLDDSGHFLSRLLGLSLNKVPENERKKTGPAPHGDEIDRRKVWNPTIKIEGEKTKAECDVWKTRWPKDDSLLSSCDLQLYFAKGQDNFAFPYWIEASNGHYTHAVKTVDSGRSLTSALTQTLPHRPPRILQIKKMEGSARFTIKSPAYYKSYQLFVFDVTKPYENIGPFAFTLSKAEEKETIYLDVNDKELGSHLKTGHRYKWILMPANSTILYVESEDFFLWPSLASK